MTSKPMTHAEAAGYIQEACKAHTSALNVGIEPKVTNSLDSVTVHLNANICVTFKLEGIQGTRTDPPDGDSCVLHRVKAYVHYPAPGTTTTTTPATAADMVACSQLLHKVALWASKVEKSFPLVTLVVCTKTMRTYNRAFVVDTHTRKFQKGLGVGKSVTFTLDELLREHVEEALVDGSVSFAQGWTGAREYRLEKPWDSESFILTRTS